MVIAAAVLCLNNPSAGIAQTMPGELAAIYRREVTPILYLPVEEQMLYAGFLPDVRQDGIIQSPQYILLVDRSAQVQAIFLFWLEPGETPMLIGASPVSTGRPGQFDHFETPAGTFEHTTDNPDFRAEGTRNALGIRGYGVKGMRVFDFGWQQAMRGWGRGGMSTMRLQMHATDPAILEPRLGTRQSKGCIRIPASLNRLLDTFGVIDADYANAESRGVHLAVPINQPSVYGPGKYLIVMDSQRSLRPAWASPQVPPAKIGD